MMQLFAVALVISMVAWGVFLYALAPRLTGSPRKIKIVHLALAETQIAFASLMLVSQPVVIDAASGPVVVVRNVASGTVGAIQTVEKAL